MERLPALTGKQVLRVLQRAGFIEDRRRGSHVILYNPATKTRTVIPVHAGKTIKRPLLKAILDEAKLSVQEFRQLL